jgi:hypothetical protein
MTKRTLDLLVGDNPFHGISHLSQERARARIGEPNADSTQQATRLVELSLQNGANGFMFSVDETTLSIIRNLTRNTEVEKASLYAIAPYAYSYVRKSTQTGGVSGLAKSLAKEMVFSSNVKVLALNLGGILRFNLSALLKTYVAYELSRIKSASGGKLPLKSFMLHEIVTDMALALNMEKLFKSYIKFLEGYHIRPGLETRNFPYLVAKFSEWGIDFSKLTLTSSFNKVGFQMCPSQLECEDALERAKDAEVIAMSVLAAGYLKPQDAIGYLTNLDGISGLVIGVSKERQALETFRVFERGILTATA